MGAMVMRILLLMSIAWIIRLTEPLFTVPIFNHEFSGRDLILAGGGLFLLFKATREIHERLEGEDGHVGGPRRAVARPRSSGRSCCSTSCSRWTR